MVKKATETKRTPDDKAGKKARKAWTPGVMMPELSVPDGYVPRWCRNDPKNISKKLSEGWVFCNKLKYSVPGFDNQDLRSHENSSQGGVVINDLVGMMLPIELAEERRAYMEEETAEATRAVVRSDSAHVRYGNRASEKMETKVDGYTIVE